MCMLCSVVGCWIAFCLQVISPLLPILNLPSLSLPEKPAKEKTLAGNKKKKNCPKQPCSIIIIMVSELLFHSLLKLKSACLPGVE